MPFSSTMTEERTYIMVKPDGVQRSLAGDIIHRFERRGYKLIAMKMLKARKELLEEHYGHLKNKSVFPKIIAHMSSGPVICMIWEGKDAVNQGRAMLGATNPLSSSPGTIRGDYGIDIGRNICHGSDSVENAEKEIKMWFTNEEIQCYQLEIRNAVYE